MWESIGMEDYQRKKRAHVFYIQMEELVNRIITSEKALAESVKKDVEDFSNEIRCLREEMKMAPFVQDALTGNSLASIGRLDLGITGDSSVTSSSGVSVITPVRQITNGPATSSPLVSLSSAKSRSKVTKIPSWPPINPRKLN